MEWQQQPVASWLPCVTLSWQLNGPHFPLRVSIWVFSVPHRVWQWPDRFQWKRQPTCSTLDCQSMERKLWELDWSLNYCQQRNWVNWMGNLVRNWNFSTFSGVGRFFKGFLVKFYWFLSEFQVEFDWNWWKLNLNWKWFPRFVGILEFFN